MTWADPIESDKHYWHRYSGFYRRRLDALGPVSTILEYGVFKGASIRWLREIYPAAQIFGIDIVPQQLDWPNGPGITYRQCDQGDRDSVARLVRELSGPFDLVIEDGSQTPRHQAASLAETFPAIRPGGLYILEDLHTSHPTHPIFRETCAPGTLTSLHLLLRIEQLQAQGRDLAASEAAAFARLTAGMFTTQDVVRLAALTQDVELYKRASLPLACYACGTADFDLPTMLCACGAQVDILTTDSLTAALVRR